MRFMVHKHFSVQVDSIVRVLKPGQFETNEPDFIKALLNCQEVTQELEPETPPETPVKRGKRND